MDVAAENEAASSSAHAVTKKKSKSKKAGKLTSKQESKAKAEAEAAAAKRAELRDRLDLHLRRHHGRADLGFSRLVLQEIRGMLNAAGEMAPAVTAAAGLAVCSSVNRSPASRSGRLSACGLNITYKEQGADLTDDDRGEALIASRGYSTPAQSPC